jgi:hypothetical protein
MVLFYFKALPSRNSGIFYNGCVITSSHNPKISELRALFSRRRDRRSSGVFIAEGVRLIEEGLASGQVPRQL